MKYTDNEIIKAAEHCFVAKNCKDCPLDRGEHNNTCIYELRMSIVDLLRRQNEQNEILQKTIFRKEDLMQMLQSQKQAYYDELVSAKAEIERLKKEVAKEFTCFVGEAHKVDGCPYLDELKKAYEKIEDLEIKNMHLAEFLAETETEQDKVKVKIKELEKRYELAVAEREANVKGFTDTLNTIKAETRKELAEQIKMAFYYEFDELIPSIMADKIDKLVSEYEGVKNETT